MAYFARLNPLRAIRDLRRFLAYRSKHELWFGLVSVVLTAAILVALQLDSRVPPPEYTREITYFDNWPADRSDAEIIAKQKIDQVAKDKKDAELKAWRENRKAQFKKIDDQLDSMGF